MIISSNIQPQEWRLINMSMTELEQHYNKFNEEKRLDSRHGQVEYITSMKYIHKYLDKLKEESESDEKPIRILDIGAGTGRYSVPLANEGYDVSAVELVKHNLGLLKAKNSSVKAYQGNALKLKRFSDGEFDMALLFGPMYHLFSHEDKLKALMECLDEGRLTEDYHTVSSKKDLYDYMRTEDIARLNSEAGLTRIQIISPDGAANYIRPYLNKLTDEEFGEFIKYHLSTCERADMLGAAAHTLDILRNEA